MEKEVWLAIHNLKISCIARALRIKSALNFSLNWGANLRLPLKWAETIRAQTQGYAAIVAARSGNMPKDNVDRAIKKGAGGGEGDDYEEIRYEGYGPGGVAIIVEALTDNRNRTASEVRSIFSKNGGSLAESGAVSFMFERVGEVRFEADAANAESMFESALEAGANDVVSSEDGHEIICQADDLHVVSQALEAAFGEPSSAKLIWRAQNAMDVDEKLRLRSLIFSMRLMTMTMFNQFQRTLKLPMMFWRG